MSAYEWHMWKPDDPFTPEPLKTIDCTCYHCGKITRHPMKSVESAEAKYWHDRHDRLLGGMNQALADVRSMFGDDPMSIMTRDLLVRLREAMQLLRLDSEGEEWKGKRP